MEKNNKIIFKKEILQQHAIINYQLSTIAYYYTDRL